MSTNDEDLTGDEAARARAVRLRTRRHYRLEPTLDDPDKEEQQREEDEDGKRKEFRHKI